jgi:hypothetical protein
VVPFAVHGRPLAQQFCSRPPQSEQLCCPGATQAEEVQHPPLPGHVLLAQHSSPSAPQPRERPALHTVPVPVDSPDATQEPFTQHPPPAHASPGQHACPGAPQIVHVPPTHDVPGAVQVLFAQQAWLIPPHVPQEPLEQVPVAGLGQASVGSTQVSFTQQPPALHVFALQHAWVAWPHGLQTPAPAPTHRCPASQVRPEQHAFPLVPQGQASPTQTVSGPPSSPMLTLPSLPVRVVPAPSAKSPPSIAGSFVFVSIARSALVVQLLRETMQQAMTAAIQPQGWCLTVASPESMKRRSQRAPHALDEPAPSQCVTSGGPGVGEMGQLTFNQI